VILSTSAAHAADCTWTLGVKKTEGGYLYTDACHNRVGLTLKDNDDYKIEVEALRKTIDIQKLVIDKADERTILWRNESYEQFDRLQKQASMNEYQKTLWFILGVVVTSAAVYGAGQLK
jgi:hypothetical protein